jgi:hypothetical protein
MSAGTGSGNVVPVGGTSGSGANTLSMNVGGVDVNYDLGPSISTLTGQALSFLQGSFATDKAFEGAAIYGANNLIAGLTSPLISGATDQLKENATQIPQLFSTMENNNYNLGQAAINMSNSIAQASIASSEASAQAASSAGGCYITSAVCESLGLPDDCHTLKTLRAFRDTFLMRTNVGRAFVAEYYATAPALVAKIRARVDGAAYLQGLYDRFIFKALLAIEWRRPGDAFKLYRRMIYAVREENP